MWPTVEVSGLKKSLQCLQPHFLAVKSSNLFKTLTKRQNLEIRKISFVNDEREN